MLSFAVTFIVDECKKYQYYIDCEVKYNEVAKHLSLLKRNMSAEVKFDK